MTETPVLDVGGMLRGGRAVPARVRLTLLLTGVLLALQGMPGGTKANRKVVRTFGITWHTLASGQWWRLVTDVLVQGRPGLRWSILIPFLWVGIAEWHLGWRRTAVAFFVTDWVSTISTLVVLRLMSPHSHWAARQIATFDSGSSAAIYGTLAAFCASRRGSNSWIAPVLLVQTMATIWLTNHRLFDVQHLISITVGLVLGYAFWRQAPVASVSRSSSAES